MNPGLSRNCHRGANLQRRHGPRGWKAEGNIDPGARTPPALTPRGWRTRWRRLDRWRSSTSCWRRSTTCASRSATRPGRPGVGCRAGRWSATRRRSPRWSPRRGPSGGPTVTTSPRRCSSRATPSASPPWRSARGCCPEPCSTSRRTTSRSPSAGAGPTASTSPWPRHRSRPYRWPTSTPGSIDGHLAPFVDTAHRSCRVGAALLWGNVAASCASSFGAVAGAPCRRVGSRSATGPRSSSPPPGPRSATAAAWSASASGSPGSAAAAASGTRPSRRGSARTARCGRRRPRDPLRRHAGIEACARHSSSRCASAVPRPPPLTHEGDPDART